MALPQPTYVLTGSDGRPYVSQVPGRFGGYRSSRVYGRLDCASALRALAHGGYVPQRVFFADEQAAIDAGYRPCAVCLPEQYARSPSAARLQHEPLRAPVGDDLGRVQVALRVGGHVVHDVEVADLGAAYPHAANLGERRPIEDHDLHRP